MAAAVPAAGNEEIIPDDAVVPGVQP